MLAWSPSGRRYNIPKSELDQIEFIDKQINDAHQIVFADIVVQYIGHQRHLLPVFPFNESLHRLPHHMLYA